jgi:photosystem II stability/assembly factor-like uncharacterized protein
MNKYFLILIIVVSFSELFSQVITNHSDNINNYIYAEGIVENSQGDIFIAVPYGVGPFILKSTDQGKSWAISDSGFIGGVEPEVIICDENDVVYFAGHGQSLYKSIDNGISWQRISPFGSAFDIYSLTITQSGELFIGIFDGWERVLKTPDGGLTWQDCSNGINSYVNCLASIQNTVFVGTLHNGLLFSNDLGNTWQQSEFDSGFVKSISTDPSGNLYANYNTEIFRSDNFGNSWINIFRTQSAFWGKILPISDTEIFVINQNQIYRSLNGAQDWDTISTFPENIILNDIYLSSDSVLYLSTNNGIYKSVDFSETWNEIDLGLTNIIYDDKLHENYNLSQNYPNPFNPTTKISWQLPEASFVTLKIFNSLGEEVETLVNEFMNAGIHSKLYIVNSALPSGVYFYQLKTGDYLQTKKMILIK